MSRAPEHLALPVGRWIDHQPRVFDAAQEGFQREVDLQARQRTTHAGVDTAAPTEVLVVPAFGIEIVRVREAGRVAVGRAVHEVHRRTLGDDRAADLDVCGGAAAGKELHRRLQPLHLLDGPGNEFGSAAHKIERLGVAQQHQHAVGDGVDSGVMTGDQQQHCVGGGLLGGHGPVWPIVVDQLGQQPFAGLSKIALDQVSHVPIERGGAFSAFLRAGLAFLGGCFRAQIQPGHEVEDPAVKHGFVLERNAQDLANHRYRHRVGVIVDNVEPGLTFGLGVVEQLVAQPLNIGLHLRNDVR